jgi:N4-gp56 family major capsid protein
MADTNVATGLTVQQWDDKYFTEYLTENRFAGEMGTDEASIIQVKEDLTKKAGDSVTFALVNKLNQAAITGSNTLEGNEERMDSRSFRLYVDKRRNGVRVAEIDEQYSAISLRNAAKSVLKDWSMKDTESLVIQALASINGVNYASASDAQKDAWLTDNTDRVYFASGYASTDHSAGLAELDTSNDKLTAADITAMKYKALVTASPKIRPIRSAENGRHYFILYCDPRVFRDLKAESSSPIIQAQRESIKEMENNRLFQGGDLLWDGVIIKEVHQMYDELVTPFTNVGDSSTTEVGCAFLCGAQAVGAAYAKRWTSKEETFDYGDKKGVAIESIYGIKKMQFGSGASDTADLKDQGVITGYFATTN